MIGFLSYFRILITNQRKVPAGLCIGRHKKERVYLKAILAHTPKLGLQTLCVRS